MSAVADRIRLAYVEETTYGEIPSGSPTLKEACITGEGLGQDTTTQQSNKIRPDQQPGDVIRTGISVSGDINSELVYGAHDDFLEAATLSADWSGSATHTGTDISAVNSTNTINRATGDWVADGFTQYSWIRIDGFTGDTANNGYARIASLTATDLTLDHITLADDSAGESVTITQADQIINGTENRSFSFEKEFTDTANEFHTFAGVSFSGFTLTVPSDGPVTITFPTLGKVMDTATSTFGDGSPTAPPANRVIAGVDGIQNIFRDGSVQPASNFTLEFTNNLRARTQIATLGTVSTATGTVGVSGTLQSYFTSSAQMQQYLAFTDLSLACVAEDSSGNAYIFYVPAANFSAGRNVAGGPNTDIINDMSYQGKRAASEDFVLQIARMPAA